MPLRKSSRLRQSTLAFVPTRDSPSGGSKQPANVRYKGNEGALPRPVSIEKRSDERVESSVTDAQNVQHMGLPTPNQSSQPSNVNLDGPISSDSESDADELPQTPKRTGKRPSRGTNTTAFFTPARSSPRMIQSKSGGSSQKPPAKPQNSLFKSSPSQATSKGSHRLQKASAKLIKGEEESSDEEDQEPVNFSRNRTSSKSRQISKLVSDEDEEEEFQQTVKRYERSTRNRHGAIDLTSEASESDDEKRKLRSSDRKQTCSPLKVDTDHDFGISKDMEGEDSGAEFSPPVQMSGRSKMRAKKLDFVVSDDDGSEEDVKPVRRRPRAQPVSSSSEEEDLRTLSSPVKRPRLGSGRRRSRHSEVQEAEDLQEDLDFLKKAPDSPPLMTPVKLSEREKKRRELEKMKEKRAQRSGPSSDPVVLDLPSSESEHMSLQLEAEREQDGDDSLDNEDEQNFVVEDDEDADLHPDIGELPIEFTRHAHKPLKEHFKMVVEWTVHRKLNPAFEREDPIYVLAFRKVNDEVRGYANSKLISSQWKADFNRALRARPIFTEEATERSLFREHCAACNRINHPATFLVRFSGKAYDQETLENLKDDSSSSESEDDDDSTSVDVNGNKLVPEDHEFFLGKFCRANSARAHALLHWKWHLNDWIMDWLKNAGYTTAEAIVEREGWSNKKRAKYANQVVDVMAEDEVYNLWRDFRSQLSAAREQKLYF